MLSNISFKVQYIPSKRNSVADSIFVLSGWDSEIWCKMQVLGQLQFANGFGRSNGRIQEAYPQFISPRFTQDIQTALKIFQIFFQSSSQSLSSDLAYSNTCFIKFYSLFVNPSASC